MVGKKGNTILLSEMTKTEKGKNRKRQPEKWVAENWATGKFGNEK